MVISFKTSLSIKLEQYGFLCLLFFILLLAS